jgi:DNA-binding helix-hairpin-helix protein with protein kinase domain
MVKVIYDDGTEREFEEGELIYRDELSEKYVAKEDYDELQAKYDKKKEQTKQAYANQDKVKQEAFAEAEERMATRLREEI